MLAAMLGIFGSAYMYGGSGNSSVSGITGGLLLLVIVIAVLILVVEIIGASKVFQKAGRPGWAVIIPFYSSWVLFEISGKPGWWMLTVFLSIIPIVGWIPYFVLFIIAMLELAKRFDKSTAFAVFGLILFTAIGMPILGFSKSQYRVGPSAGNSGAGMPPMPPPPPPPAAA
jgi:hypothetical protein